jgi:hypothetical protein
MPFDKMWKVLSLLALLACANADLLSVEFQDPTDTPGLRSETVYLVESEVSGQPHVVGMVQRYEAEGTQAIDAVNTLFGADQFFSRDEKWNSWVDQQLDLLQTLHSFIFGPPCGHGFFMEGGMDNDIHTVGPAMLARMAASRFGPALVEFYNQDDALEYDAPETATYSTDSYDSDTYDYAAVVPPNSRAPYAVVPDSGQPGPRTTAAQYEGFASAYYNPQEYAAAAYYDAQDYGAAEWAARGEQERADWSLILFFVLCFACIVVWVGLLRMLCSFNRQVKQARNAPHCLTVVPGSKEEPLLMPLQREAAVPVAEQVVYVPPTLEVAAEHVAGVTQFVTIQYAPVGNEGYKA